VGKFCAVLILLTLIFGVLSFVVAPYYDHGLPRDISETGWAIDHLFTFILWLTGVVFVATEFVLFWFLWKYDAKRNREPPKFMHGSHTLEVIWTIIPAATLLFISLYQMNAWAQEKMRNPGLGPDGIAGTVDDLPATVEVTARQFEWRLRYAGDDKKLGTRGDIFVVNDLHLPVGEEILIDLKSQDVLHSFFLPNMRVKQDAVPGMKIPVWFKAKEVGRYDIVCAELCGWGHYKMKGRITIESRRDYERWLKERYAEQSNVKSPEPAPEEESE
jgi:cytochrome c oxidase subunit 2